MLLLYFSIIMTKILYAETGQEMIFIKEGKYIPLFKSETIKEDYIKVNSFFINKYPITNSMFKDFILKNKKWNIDNIKKIIADENYLSHWKENDFENIKDMPVVNVSWFAANAYCSYIGARLPTINEWEYVASASKDNPIGKNDPNFLKNILDWYLKSQTKKIVNVESMNNNYWGVFGMHGIIWEWVYDFNSVIILNTDAEGGGLEEVLYCGGASINAIDPADYVTFMRFAFRNSLEANYTMARLGFRCVKNEKN